MQTLRHDISLTTYILIALHFLRLSIHRATPEVLHGNPAVTIPAGQFYSKLVFFFYSNDELQALEFYTNTREELTIFYRAVSKEFKENYHSIYYIQADVDLKEALCHNKVLSASLDIIKKHSPHLSVVERNRVRQKNSWHRARHRRQIRIQHITQNGQDMLKQITNATYILIVLHFIRLAVRRATVNKMPNYPAETPSSTPDGYGCKVGLLYRMATGTYRAMEFYTKTLQANNELYHQIVKAYPEYTKIIYSVLAKDNIPETYRSKSPLGEVFRLLQPRAPILAQNEYSEILHNILSIIGNCNTYRDIKIC